MQTDGRLGPEGGQHRDPALPLIAQRVAQDVDGIGSAIAGVQTRQVIGRTVQAMPEDRRHLVLGRLVELREARPGLVPVGGQVGPVRCHIVKSDTSQILRLVRDQIADRTQLAGEAGALAQQRRQREASAVLEAGKADIDLHGPARLFGRLAPGRVAGDFHNLSAAGFKLGVGDVTGQGFAVKLQHKSTP